MNYFPAFLDLNAKPCLVVGGGAAAAAKARLLLKAGAEVRVVAPRMGPEIAELAGQGALRLLRRRFAAGDLSGQAAVIGTTGIATLDEEVAAAAVEARVPVNVVDRPDLCGFIVPAIVERGPVVVAISSAGTAPVLARRLRARIEALLPARLGALARFAESFRSAVKAVIPEPAARLRFWDRVFDGPVAEEVLAGREPAARERMLGLLNRSGAAAVAEVPGASEGGQVHIVGAGPGDPDLLTLRALRLLGQAEVVIYDKLVGPEILDYLRRDAERIYVGKSRCRHTRSQAEINALMVARARAGKRVLRLKGGDPFIFGRGGEELAYLRRHGIPAQVVPGITAAAGCAAATGIPLTHRDQASAVTLVTGHGKDGEPDLDWARLAQLNHTLVVYMGVATADRTAERLIAHGLAAQTPVAVIENGTLENQKTVAGTLGELGSLVRAGGIRGPAIIVIGEVAGQAAFGDLPARLDAVAG
ncbi:MAG: siroheme synthase CysG [Kiloniellales bacterium]